MAHRLWHRSHKKDSSCILQPLASLGSPCVAPERQMQHLSLKCRHWVAGADASWGVCSHEVLQLGHADGGIRDVLGRECKLDLGPGMGLAGRVGHGFCGAYV